MKPCIRLLSLLLFCAVSASTLAQAQIFQTFQITDYIDHAWSEEIVTFPYDVPTTSPVHLTDAAGNVVQAQFYEQVIANGRTKGKVTTVINQLAGGATATYQLRAGVPGNNSDLGWLNDAANDRFVFWNDRMTISIPRFNGGGVLPSPVPLTSLPVPILGVRNTGGSANGAGTWMTGGSWFNNGAPLMVKQALVNAFEVGPVRHRFRIVYIFTDNTAYAFDLYLGSKQDAATVIESTSSTSLPDAGWRFSMKPGLNANRVFWQDQSASAHSMKDAPVSFAQDNQIARMRPWSFWWNSDVANWAGFYQAGSPNFFGVFMRKPSLWAPSGNEAQFVETEVPITARTTGAIDLTLRLKVGLQRHWGFTAKATTAGWVQPPGYVSGDPNVTPTNVSKLRLLLVKYSEFPLDEVKDFGFDFNWAHAARPKPFLIMSPADVSRARSQYAANEPFVKQQVTWSKYYTDSVHPYTLYQTEYQANGRVAASKAFYAQKYEGNNLRSTLLDLYLGTSESQYEELLAAAVRSMGKHYLRIYMEAPVLASIGAHAHTLNAYLLPVLLNLDLIYDSPHMSAAEKAQARHIALFLAHLSSHPDYFNPAKGFTAGNPNQELAAIVPRGTFGVYFAGHPKAAGWVAEAKALMDYHLTDLTAPALGSLKGGSWMESPAYQMFTMSDFLLFATALRRANNDNTYFANATMKQALAYVASLVTPPDVRYPTNNRVYSMQTQYMTGVAPPSVMPSIGDSATGSIYPDFGWVAAMTADTDPTYSRQMQHYWKMGNHQYNTMPLGSGSGFMLGLTNVSLPSQAPSELASGYNLFGNVMRTSWVDPKASYICHRTSGHQQSAGGNNTSAHWQDDENSFVFYAKGAPVSLDWGPPNHSIRNAWQHNTVSFERTGPTIGLAGGGTLPDALTSLPRTLDYSRGRSVGNGGQANDRHLLMIKSENPLGANYLVIRDKTTDGLQGQQFHFNLWSTANSVQLGSNFARFYGQTFNGQTPVNLELHVVSPVGAAMDSDVLSWDIPHAVWHTPMGETQRGVHVMKQGSTQDFFTVVYPVAQGETSPTVASLAGQKAVHIQHVEGTDWVLVSPGAPTLVTHGLASLNAEVAFARTNSVTGATRLAVSRGGGSAAYGAWQVQSTQPVAIEVTGTVTGEANGAAATVSVRAPAGFNAQVRIDGSIVPKTFTSGSGTVTYSFTMPAGAHVFTLAP